MIEPRVIYESEDFLAVNKPSGLLVHEARGAKHETREPTLAGWLLEKYPEIAGVGDDPKLRPGIVHRLDRETSGIMIVARNQKTFEYFKSLFKNRAIKKTYLALVWGSVKSKRGSIEKPIRIKNGTIKRTVNRGTMEKEAVTDYKVLKHLTRGAENREEFSLLEVRPKTGRTHQIRVHLASIGYPVVGDIIYGSKKRPNSRLMLHALSLEFTAPNGTRMKLETEPPPDLSLPGA